MRHTLPWIATGLLLLGGGCQIARFDLEKPMAAPQALALPEELPGGVTPASYCVRPAIPASAAVATLPVSLGAPSPAASLAPPPAVPVGPVRAEAMPILAAVGPVEWQLAAPSHGGATLERPAGAVAAHSRSADGHTRGHASDYCWLLGCLEHDDARRCWMVHYADGREPDEYGGWLELIKPGPMTGFRCGQLVRVEGELVDPAPHEIRPAYRVHSLQVIRR